MERLNLAAVFTLTLAVSGCATLEPYALLDTNRIGTAAVDESGVVITAAGPQAMLRGQAHVMISPGKQLVEVRTLRTDPKIGSRLATLPIDAKPCFRYVIVAKHPVNNHPRDWYAEIISAEPIPECVAAMAQTAK
jgi:hypothetical protein